MICAYFGLGLAVAAAAAASLGVVPVRRLMGLCGTTNPSLSLTAPLIAGMGGCGCGTPASMLRGLIGGVDVVDRPDGTVPEFSCTHNHTK